MWINWKLHTPTQNVKWYSCFGIIILQKVIYTVTILPRNSTLGIHLRQIKTCPQKKLCMNIHSSIICKSKKVKIIQMPTNWWPDKQIVVYPNNGIIFIHKKEWSTDRHYKDEPWKEYAKWKKVDTKDHISYGSIYTICLEYGNP